MKTSKKNTSQVPQNDFLTSIQKELNAYLSIPYSKDANDTSTTKNVSSVEQTATVERVEIKKEFKFKKEYQNFTSVIDEINHSISSSKKKTSLLQEVKSAKSIIEINKIRNAITILENRYNNSIAKKYLIGFLEEKGFTSFNEYVNCLA